MFQRVRYTLSPVENLHYFSVRQEPGGRKDMFLLMKITHAYLGNVKQYQHKHKKGNYSFQINKNKCGIHASAKNMTSWGRAEPSSNKLGQARFELTLGDLHSRLFFR